MGYYRLVKDGPTIDNILKCFNTWDFSTYPTIKSYVDTKIAGTVWGNITGTLADQTDLANALNSKATDSNVVHLTGNENIDGLKTFVNTIHIKESENNSVALQCLGSNKLQIGSNVGVSSTLCIGAYGGESHRGQVEINADGEITCKEDDYGITAYLKLPARGTSSQRATLATLNDIPSVSDFVTMSTAQSITGYKTFNRANTDDPIFTLIGGWSANAKTYDFKVSNDGLNIHRNGYAYVQFVLKDGELQTQSLKPAGASASYNIGGPNNYGYYNLYLKNKIYSNNNDTYGLVLPDTTNWTADKTIATTVIGDSSTYTDLSTPGKITLHRGAGGTGTDYSEIDFNGNSGFSGTLTLRNPGSTSSYVVELPAASGTLALQSEIPANLVNTFAGETGDITINTNYFELSAQKELEFKAHLYQHFIYLYNSSDKTHICFGLISLHPVALSLSEMITYVRAMLIDPDAKISATGTIKIGGMDHKYVGAIGKGSNDGELLVFPMQSTGGYDTSQVITASSSLTMVDNCVAIL